MRDVLERINPFCGLWELFLKTQKSNKDSEYFKESLSYIMKNSCFHIYYLLNWNLMYLSENVYLLKLWIKMFEVDVEQLSAFLHRCYFPYFSITENLKLYIETSPLFSNKHFQYEPFLLKKVLEHSSTLVSNGYWFRTTKMRLNYFVTPSLCTNSTSYNSYNTRAFHPDCRVRL